MPLLDLKKSASPFQKSATNNTPVFLKIRNFFKYPIFQKVELKELLCHF